MERGLHYEVHGSGELLLLIHGTGSSFRVWEPIVGLLAAHRTVIPVDLPGFGFSPPITPGTPPTPGGFAGILAAFLRRLGHDDAHVAGNSVGGWTALEMAKLGVARSVVALSPGGSGRGAPRSKTCFPCAARVASVDSWIPLCPRCSRTRYSGSQGS